MIQIISDHNIPIKVKKRIKKIEDEDIKVDFILYAYQSEPTISILDIPLSNSKIKEFEEELKSAFLDIFNKYKKELK
ncbi:MAG: hypothetical protein M0Q13_11635 [Methanothrix sp.]|jgi:hypothetical protein|nr:hypothetical protein [Methanothrix sp.]